MFWRGRYMSKRTLRAFSLVELSIVLVVAGLLVASVTGGMDLWRATRLRAVMSEIEGYHTAIRAFRLQFNEELPGDMPNAQDFFGAADCPDDGLNTCNGNGDGVIEAGTIREDLRTWQHLSLAEVILEQYTGELDGNNKITIEVNVPRSKMKTGGYAMRSVLPPDTSIYGRTGNFITFATETSPTLQGAVLDTPSAVVIDKKMDDGLADQGDVLTADGTNVAANSCVDGNIDDATSNYILANEEVRCRMFFYLEEN